MLHDVYRQEQESSNTQEYLAVWGYRILLLKFGSWGIRKTWVSHTPGQELLKNWEQKQF